MGDLYSDAYGDYCEFADAKKEINQYNELLLAVETKCPNETRHETALRYIREAEKGSQDSHCLTSGSEVNNG